MLRERRQRVLDRIENCPGPERDLPMMAASNIHYELADRVQGLAAGGIGAMLLLAQRTGLVRDINAQLHVLKRHQPYHESDHVLNIAFNFLAGGTHLEHIELRRNDEVYLNALGAQRIPDPTTEGDFCRRFAESDVVHLMDTINCTRQRVWAQQPPAFFAEAILDADGTIVATDAECKKGMNFAYNSQFGYHPLLVSLAEDLPATAYSFLERPPRYAIKTVPRQRPERIKPEIVRERGYKTIHLLEEMVAEFEYRPTACHRTYRMIVLRKRLGIDEKQLRLFEEYRYFFYITNDWETPADEIVFLANDRCDQENLIAQLKGGVHALTTPVDTLESNWAYMVMASLAWSLKAWSALLVPVSPRHAAKHEAEKRTLLRMEFATFCAAMIQMPCQIVRTGKRLIYRLLSWTPWQGTFLRLVERLHGCWLC
jgi:hypothetical protein